MKKTRVPFGIGVRSESDRSTNTPRAYGTKIRVKRSKNRALQFLRLTRAVYDHLKMFNSDGTPKVHVRHNGSRYIYPQALFQSAEFQQTMGLEDSRTSPKEKAEAG